MESQAGPNRSAKPQQALGEPFDSAYAVEQALQSRDPAALQAALAQIDKRALALVAKEAPRGQPDLLLDYVKQNPGCNGVFAAWDLANKTNNSPLSAAALSCLTSLVRLASTDPFTSSPEIIKSLFSTQYAPYFERSLNPGRNDVTTAVLKLCNVLVGFAGGKYAKRVFGCFGWSPKVTSRLYKTRLRSLTSFNALAKPDIRTLLVLLVVSFLSAGDVRLKAQVLETKGLLSGVFKGLNEDAEVVVNLVLETVGRELVQERRVALDARRNIFDESCFTELCKLYDYPLPVGDSDLPASHPSLSVHRFFRLISAWLADQIATSPVGRSSGPQRVLATLLRALKVTEDSVQRELGLEILRSAPVLAGAFWAKFPSSLDPRLSSRWVSAITFATQVVGLPVAATLSIPASAENATLIAPPSVSSILDTVLPPATTSSLNRAWYTKALTHEVPLVSFLSSLFLLSILQKAATVLETMAETSLHLEEGAGGRWATQTRKVREELRLRLPDPSIVVGLMTRTAAAASGEAPPGGSGKKSAASRESAVGAVDGQAVVAPGSEGALLRTNVALRILFLYHRVSPQLIATLRFDFAKLPQTYARRPTGKSGGAADQGEEGVRAISSAYALRLAAAHSTSSSITSFNRPGDHYKQSLVPLFQLYRTPSTASNRSLLREILKRQLDTPLLFGTSAAEEIEVWLRALPVPTGAADEVEAVLSFFETAVQKTLTSPLKSEDAQATGAQQALSPLLQNVIAAMPNALKGDEEDVERILAFYRDVALHLAAQQTTLDAAQHAVHALRTLVEEQGPASPASTTAQLLGDCLTLLTDVSAPSTTRDGLAGTLSSLVADADLDALSTFVGNLSPTRENVFAALGSTSETATQVVETVVAAMPLTLALLHVRAADVGSASVRGVIRDVVDAQGLHLPAVQLLLHRLALAYSEGFATLIVEIFGQAGGPREIAQRVASERGLLQKFSSPAEELDTYRGILGLLVSILQAQDPRDRELAQPFCRVVLSDLDSVGAQPSPKKKRKHRESDASAARASLPDRVLAAGPLLPFLDGVESLPLLDALVSHSERSELDDSAKAVLEAALDGVLSLPASEPFIAFWSAHLLRLNALSKEAGSQAAARVIMKGVQAIMPFADPKIDASAPWRLHAASWTEALLSAGDIGPTQAAVLTALVYRSADARRIFLAWIRQQGETTDVDVLAVSSVLGALIRVTSAKGETLELPTHLATRLVEQVLEEGGPVAEALEAILTAMPEAADSVRNLLLERIGATPSFSTLERALTVLRAVLPGDPAARSALEKVVNSSFAPLTRIFVDSSDDYASVQDFVTLLAHAVEDASDLELEGGALDVLLTAIATYVVSKPGASRLGAALCGKYRLKDNEVSRHLNEIYASTAYLTLAANPAQPYDVPARDVLQFIRALASTSVAAAANARTVERLMPFYRGTVHEQDRSLLDYFQKIELMSPASISPAFRGWIPTSERDISLDGTRVGALSVADKKAIRRSWARAFASSRTLGTSASKPVSDAAAGSADVEVTGTYDPVFLTSFVATLIEEDEMKPQDWTTLLESGVLGTVVASLASSSPGLRGIARTALSGLAQRIQPLSFREKDELELVLTQIRLTLYSPAGEPIPASIALFLAHCLAVVGRPESPLYPTFTRFLLQRATIDARDVPMFYSMLYSSNADEFAAAPRDERLWMVRFLTEGLARTQDWKIYRRRQVFELLASLFSSTRQDPQIRKAVLMFLVRATRIHAAARELVSRNGLLGWLSVQAWQDAEERQFALDTVLNVLAILPWDKLPGVADAVEAVEGAVRGFVNAPLHGDGAAVEYRSVVAFVRQVVTHLASPPAAQNGANNCPPLLRIILARLSDLLREVAPLAAKHADQDFYATVMLLSFARHEAGIAEKPADARLWTAALKAGVDAGVEEVATEILKLRSG